MKPALLCTLLLLLSLMATAQQPFMLLKKGRRTVQTFHVGMVMAFQTADRQWHRGNLLRIQNDSLYLRPWMIQNDLFRTDTIYFETEVHHLAAIFAMPKKGVLIDFSGGRFQPSGSGGHQHWYWLKSGLVLKLGAASYAFLHTANGLIAKDFSWRESRRPLLTAAGVFALGWLLKKRYRPYWALGRKYRLEVFYFNRPPLRPI